MSNRNPEVEAWLAAYDNPRRDLVAQVREVVLSADPEVTESIKWQAPTFMFRGNIASFFPKSKKTVTLMFHQGATIADPDGLLEGDGAVSRVARFADADDLERKRAALQAIIRAWIDERR
ncbi:DUF1801 domain-containing protein [Microbacterium sp. ASV49]|uniref:DUF1801 domain-containing protein n=1 Tax=Microbacterium candidum TaxID=3041922 RepID=A0ABT7N030_9MICO|nr:DUF1801 domain-containing protein [Microbacterium sp. ASV49]MDL9980061.1 DUF1801 domain-containing protein [Microbacterium sp. ASV49]